MSSEEAPTSSRATAPIISLNAWEQKDVTAQELFLTTIPPEIASKLALYDTSAEMWTWLLKKFKKRSPVATYTLHNQLRTKATKDV